MRALLLIIFVLPLLGQDLPNVFLIGDSIAGGYGPAVKEILNSRANVQVVNRKIINGATDNGLEELDDWLGKTKWTVIHFNWGLWDLKIDAKGRNTIPIEVYGKNLRTLIARMKTTGARLIFATTTPVPEIVMGGGRRAVDVPAYNAVARRICEEEGVYIDDLYTLVKPRTIEFQYPNNVHFTAEGSQFLGRHVAQDIAFILDTYKK